MNVSLSMSSLWVELWASWTGDCSASMLASWSKYLLWNPGLSILELKLISDFLASYFIGEINYELLVRSWFDTFCRSIQALLLAILSTSTSNSFEPSSHPSAGIRFEINFFFLGDMLPKYFEGLSLFLDPQLWFSRSPNLNLIGNWFIWIELYI